ncbi:MAG: hypothetical protein ACRDUA_13495, partial [Micromonosporaceae bacterium]
MFTLVVNVTVPSGNLIDNTATVASTTTDPDPANNTAFAQASVAGSANLSVTKTDSPDPVTAGNNLNYTIAATNNGPENAQNAALSDNIPPGTTFVSLASPAGWSCTTPAVGATGTVSCGNPLLGGGSGVFTLVVNVNAGVASGTIIGNTATVSSSTFDPNTSNNSATATTPVHATADLSVTKTDSPDPVTAGTNITYTITVSNAGPSDAAVQLTDGVPTNTTFVSFTAPAGWTTVFTPPPGGTGGITATKTVAAGEPASVFTLVVNVNANASSGSTITNLASVGSGTSDPNDANNTALASTSVNTSADLSVTKTDSPDPVTAGNNLTYSMTASNAGPSDAQTVSLSDTVPANTTFVSLAAPGGWSCTTPAVGATGTVNCGVGTLAAGASAGFTLVVQVSANAPDGGTLTNTVSATTMTTDPTPANNSDTETTAVNTAADLAVTKTDSPDPVIAGNNLTYTITVANGGPSDALGVSLTDTVPAGNAFVSATPSQGTCTGTTTVTCTLGTIPAGGSATMTLVVNVNAGAPSGSTITNTATATTTTTDPNSANDSATATTTVNTSADMSIAKTDSPDPATAGTDLTYTITATNNGPSTSGGDVTVTDAVPAGTTFVSATPSQGSCSGTTTVTCNLGGLANGASATITVVVHVDPS